MLSIAINSFNVHFMRLSLNLVDDRPVITVVIAWLTNELPNRRRGTATEQITWHSCHQRAAAVTNKRRILRCTCGIIIRILSDSRPTNNRHTSNSGLVCLALHCRRRRCGQAIGTIQDRYSEKDVRQWVWLYRMMGEPVWLWHYNGFSHVRMFVTYFAYLSLHRMSLQ